MAEPNYKNKILSGLCIDDTALLLPLLNHVDLAVHKTLEARNRPIPYAYFFESGLASVVASGGSNQVSKSQ